MKYGEVRIKIKATINFVNVLRCLCEPIVKKYILNPLKFASEC